MKRPIAAVAALLLVAGSAGAVEWLSYKEGLALATAEGRPVMLLFDIGDENGKWFVERVLTSEKIAPYRDKFVAVRIRQSSGPLWKKYGVEAGPKVIFVGPTGDVLCPGWWRAAGALATSMKEALRKHGPIMAPALKAEAEKLDAQILEAMRKKDFSNALALAFRLRELTKVDPFARRVQVTIDELRQRARGALVEAAELEKKGDLLGASRAYLAIRETFEGLEEAKAASEVLRRYENIPRIAEAIAAAEREEAAGQALADAEKLYESKPHRALAAWDDIATKWPSTKAGQSAKQRAADVRADPKAMAAVRESAAAEVCPKLISLAKSYAAAGKTDVAKKYLARVLKEHPGTSFASEASKLIAKLR